jgi:RIO kinase 2
MYLSRLGAQKEWAFMQALHARGFPVPFPVDHNRHCVVMGLVQGKLLDNVQRDDMVIEEVTDPKLVDAAISWLYSELMNLILRLAEHGLIHGDFNEFNLIWEPPKKDASKTDESLCPMGRIVIIDFPQMVSTRHPNAKYYFDRDVTCIRKFFERRFGFIAEDAPDFETDVQRLVELDTELKASGFDKVAREDDLIALHDTKVEDDEDESGCEDDEDAIEGDENYSESDSASDAGL